MALRLRERGGVWGALSAQAEGRRWRAAHSGRFCLHVAAIDPWIGRGFRGAGTRVPLKAVFFQTARAKSNARPKNARPFGHSGRARAEDHRAATSRFAQLHCEKIENTPNRNSRFSLELIIAAQRDLAKYYLGFVG